MRGNRVGNIVVSSHENLELSDFCGEIRNTCKTYQLHIKKKCILSTLLVLHDE